MARAISGAISERLSDSTALNGAECCRRCANAQGEDVADFRRELRWRRAGGCPPPGLPQNAYKFCDDSPSFSHLRREVAEVTILYKQPEHTGVLP